MPENLQVTLDFLRDLRLHNERPWFAENRQRYDIARGNLELFITDLIFGFGDIEDLGGVSAKACIYRINRDVRFSRDKSPYKTHMAAVIGKGGRKSEDRSYYIQIAPGDSWVGAGLYAPSPEQLAAVRRGIADDWRELDEIIHDPEFVRHFGGLEGESLKTAPQGYAKDHPAIDLLRRKQFLAGRSLSDDEVLSPDLDINVLTMCRALKPFLTFIHDALDA